MQNKFNNLKLIPETMYVNKIAKKVGSSIKDFDSQLNVDSVNSVILKNLTLADKLSIDGTPTFIIGDNIFRGFISFDQLQEIIDNLRKKSNKLIIQLDMFQRFK